MAKEKRLIDANALWEGEFLEEENEYQRGWNDALRGAQLAAPTVDAVEVVHGRWEDEYEGVYANPKYRCSVCKGKALYRQKANEIGNWLMVQALTDYCPNCGAKMDGERKENGICKEDQKG